MTTFRCAVVSSAASSDIATLIVAELAGCGDIRAFRCEGPPSATVDIAAALLVFDAATLPRAAALIAEIRECHPAAALLAAVEGPRAGVLEALLRAGVLDFVSLPACAVELSARLRRAVGLLAPITPTEGETTAAPKIRGFVYSSESMARLAGRLTTMAACAASVMIQGETGTGKEVCAQAVHYLSPRASRPWVAVNCGAIPAELVENELFGHVKGAYTTAHTARPGLVREAEAGTLFLDDVDCLPLAAQAKLLRFLQEREYRPVGSSTVQRADVRVIAASNCNLHALAQRGAFRADLYFRLNVLRLNLPPLRERREDVLVLALHFMRQFSREFSRPVTGIGPVALRKLFAHDWPGNVRELKHVIERAVLMAGGAILGADDIELEMAGGVEDDGDSFQSAKLRVVRSFERGYLEQVLAAYSGNVTQAARAAKKDRRAFFELMRKHEIEAARFRVA